MTPPPSHLGWYESNQRMRLGQSGDLALVVSLLLSVTFACGLVIAVAHVVNRGFIAPVYDVVANLTAFSCAVAASILLHHWAPATLSSVAILCWLWLARRTFLALRTPAQSDAQHLERSGSPTAR